jgi:hypothetical protein
VTTIGEPPILELDQLADHKRRRISLLLSAATQLSPLNCTVATNDGMPTSHATRAGYPSSDACSATPSLCHSRGGMAGFRDEPRPPTGIHDRIGESDSRAGHSTQLSALISRIPGTRDPHGENALSSAARSCARGTTAAARRARIAAAIARLAATPRPRRKSCAFPRSLRRNAVVLDRAPPLRRNVPMEITRHSPHRPSLRRTPLPQSSFKET